MKQTSKMLVVIAVLLSTVTSQAKHVIPAKGTKQFQNTNTESVSIKSMGEAQKEDQLTSVFDTYFSVKDALVSSNGNDAAGKAKQMLLAIKSVKMEKLDMKVHMVWMKVVKDLTEDAEHISETKDPKHQRDHFITLSKNANLAIIVFVVYFFYTFNHLYRIKSIYSCSKTCRSIIKTT